jgi:hypothetical protein
VGQAWTQDRFPTLVIGWVWVPTPSTLRIASNPRLTLGDANNAHSSSALWEYLPSQSQCDSLSMLEAEAWSKRLRQEVCMKGDKAGLTGGLEDSCLESPWC